MPSDRALALTERFKAQNQEFVDYVAELTPEAWKRQAANADHPTARGDEVRTVGVVAYHTAVSSGLISGRVMAAAEGRVPPPLGDNDERNRLQAEEHAETTVAEVVDLARSSGARAAWVLANLTDEQLDRELTFPGGSMTVQQMVERVLIGHIDWHLRSIRAAVEGAGQ